MIALGHTLKFAAGKPLPVLLRNFYEPEEGYVWSHSRWCEIIFPFNLRPASGPKMCDLILDLDVFKAPPELASQAVMIYLNGMRIAQYDVNGEHTYVISTPMMLLRERENSLVIDTPDSTKPSAYGVKDDRVLGVQLFSAQIQPV